MPGFVRSQGKGTGIHRSGAAEGGAWKHRNGCDERPLVKKRAGHYGDGFRKLDVVQLDIGLAQENPFPVRVKVEPERFVFHDLGEGQKQDDAD